MVKIMELIKKQKKHVFGKDIYLLGEDKEGIKYWMEAGSWDCSWYWGVGYVETYTNNNYPEKSRDINSHQHFDSLFLKNNIGESYRNFFTKSTLNDSEMWRLLEYMQEIYIMRNYSDLLHSGANISSSVDGIKEEKNEESNQKEYNRINKILIPELLQKIYKLLGEE